MKTKKYRGGGQGYADREDESLGMRTGAERTKRQSMRDRRDESYGAWGKRPNQRINRKDGGTAEEQIAALLGESSRAISASDIERAKAIVKGKTSDAATIAALLGEGSRAISESDRERAEAISKLLNKKNKAKGGVASFARGGVEAADKEGSRLSVSMERQEDAGFSPSQADFDQQHRLAEEGIMDVGAAVTIVQGHDSREQLGETDGVRGGGAAIRGKNFRGVN